MLLTVILFPILCLAHVIQDDVAVTSRQRFPFKSVCLKMVTHEAPLIEVVSGSILDCMGKKIQVGDFCEKITATDPYYIRAYIDKKNNEVICVSGKKVLFKYQCIKSFDQQLCSKDSRSACLFIQERLAKRLDLVHESFIKNEAGVKELSCFFESLPLAKKN